MSDDAREDLGSAASLLEALAAAPGLDEHGPLMPGTIVADKYRIDRAIGQGGMGVVYLARDQRLDRAVAIKLGVHVSERALARFEREGQALAKLNHPNVVTIYEVGEHADRLFVAMEYVAGGTARSWCAGKSAREVLALYVAAGDGLAAAHAAGIIHRDFKPDNVLVGDDGRPRVADFGLAREVTEPEPRADPDETTSGPPLTTRGAVGTPAYMAPEQQKGGDVDERADQYAFACSLWEALTGERPEPGAAASVARAMPAHIAAALRRATSKDPADRWHDLRSLIAELRRDPGARARRIGIAVLGLAAVSGVVAIVLLARSGEDPCGGGEQRIAAVWNPERGAELERAIGARTSAVLRPRLDAFGERWVAAEHEACRAARVERTQTDEQLAQRTLCLHRARARFGAVVRELSAGGADVVERATDPLALLPDVSACADLTALGSRPAPPADPTAREKLEKLIDELAEGTIASLLKRPRDLAAADRLLARARELGWAPVIAEAEYSRAGVLVELGQHAQGRAAYTRAANLAIAAASDELAGYAHADLAWDLVLSGRFDDADREVAMAEAIRTRLGGDPALGVRILGTRRLIATGMSRPAEALALSRETVELSRRLYDDPINDAVNHLTLGAGHLAADQFAETQREVEIGLRKLEVVLGPDHPKLVQFLQTLAKAEAQLARLDEAQRDVDRALSIAEKWYGPDSSPVAHVLIDRVFIGSQRGNDAAMREDALRALAIIERTDPGSEDAAGLLLDLGVAAAKAGDLASAGQYATRAMTAFEALDNPNNPALASVLLLRGYVARGQQRYAESIADLRRAVAVSIAGGVPAATVNPKIELSYTLVLDGKAREAVDLLAPLVEVPGVPPMIQAELQLALAEALWNAGDKARARTAAAASRDAWTALGEDFAGQRAQAEAWLNQHR